MENHELRCAIDLGTTSFKAMVVDHEGKVVFEKQSRITMDTDASGAATQKTDEVWATFVMLIKEMTDFANQQQKSIAWISLSAAMHSLIAVTNEGEPLTPVFTWMDRRAQEKAKSLWEDPDGSALYERTGTPIHAMSPMVKLLWLSSFDSDVWGKKPRFVSIKEWLWYRLFGVFEVDEATAGATGLYDLKQKKWCDDALSLVGITQQQLSTIVSTTYTRERLQADRKDELGLSFSLTVMIGATDGVLANLAHRALTSDRMVLTIGTSMALRMGSERVITDSALRSFCYPLLPKRYVVGLPSNCGGVVIEWVLYALLGEDRAATSFQEAMMRIQEIDTGSLYCLPYAAGERALLWDEGASASFHGLAIHQSKVHLLRAAVEGVLFHAYRIYLALTLNMGQPNVLILSGKLFHIAWIAQFCADLFHLPVEVSAQEDASMLGALLLTTCVDDVPFFEEAQEANVLMQYVPNQQATNFWQERFTRYLAIAQHEEKNEASTRC